MDEVASRVAIGQNDQRHRVFVDPLPERRYVLHHDIRFRGVARNVTGGEQVSFGIDDRYCRSLLANSIDQ